MRTGRKQKKFWTGELEEEEEEEEEDAEEADAALEAEDKEITDAFFDDFATLRKLVLELIFLHNGKQKLLDTATNPKNGNDFLPLMFCYKQYI